MFEKLALIGIGLIGSSIAHGAREQGLVKHISIATRRAETLEEAMSLKLGDSYTTDAAEAVRDADLVILCTPVGALKPMMAQIAPHLKSGAILSDVGGVKKHVVDALGPGAAGPELGEGDSEDEVLVSVVESEDAVQAPARLLAGEVFELGDGSAFDDDAPEDAAFADVDVDVDA